MTRFIDTDEVDLAATRLDALAGRIAERDRTIRTLLARTGDAVDLDIARLRVVVEWAERSARDLRRRADTARVTQAHPAVTGRFDDLPATATLLGHLGADLHGLWQRLPEADRLAQVGGPLARWLFPAGEGSRLTTDEFVRRLAVAASVLRRVGDRMDVAVSFVGDLPAGGRDRSDAEALAEVAAIVLALMRDTSVDTATAIEIGRGLSAVLAGVIAAGAVDGGSSELVDAGLTGDRAALLALSDALPAEVVLRLTAAVFVHGEWDTPAVAGPWQQVQQALAERLSGMIAGLAPDDLDGLAPDMTALMRTVGGGVDLPTMEVTLREQLGALTIVFRHLLLPTGMAVPVEVGHAPPVLTADEVRAWLGAVSGTVASPALLAVLLADASRRATMAAASISDQLVSVGGSGAVLISAEAREWARQSRGLGAMLGLVIDAATDEHVRLEVTAQKVDAVLHKIALMLAVTGAGQAGAMIAPSLRVATEWTAAHILDELKQHASIGLATAVAAGETAEHDLLQVLRWTLYSAIAMVPGVPAAPRGHDGQLVRWWDHEPGSNERLAVERWWSDPVVAELYAAADGAEAGFAEVTADLDG